MKGNRIAIVTDHDADLVAVPPPSQGMVDPGGLPVERYPPAPVMRYRCEYPDTYLGTVSLRGYRRFRLLSMKYPRRDRHPWP